MGGIYISPGEKSCIYIYIYIRQFFRSDKKAHHLEHIGIDGNMWDEQNPVAN
jgi:hypothetical protein